MQIIINQHKEFTSKVVLEPLFEAEKLLSREKQYFAIVDSAAQWFFDKHLSNWNNVKVLQIASVDESIKTWSTVERIHEFLFQSRAERSSILLAIGGGVVLDTSGFAASIFKRGIPWISIPTTPLAQVDASIGGKTAINTGMAKNSIGAFYPPKMVLVTPAVSETWNKFHELEGVAEMYKIFRVFNHSFAEELVRGYQKEQQWIERSIQLKAEVVRIDPWEQNLRGALNYGHTFGHAFEHSTHMRHGLAVALGIRCENFVAEKIGFMSSTTRKLINRDLDRLGFDLPNHLPSFTHLKEHLLQDKKNVGGQIRLSLMGQKELLMAEKDPTQEVSLGTMEESYQSFCDDAAIKVLT